MKTCSCCKIEKHKSEFWANKSKGGLNSYCKKCSTQKSDLWKSINPENRKRYHYNWRINNLNKSRSGTIIRDIRRRARKASIPIDLDKDFVFKKLQNGRCEITGIPFEIVKGGRPSPRSPSLDRIIPNLGYVKSNVRMILYAINTFKNEWSDEDIYPIAKEFCRAYDSRVGVKKNKSVEWCAGRSCNGSPPRVCSS